MTGLAVWAAGLCLLGAAHTVAYSHTAAWPLAVLAPMVLVASLLGRPPAPSAVLAWAYGLGWLAAGVWWLFVSMHRYGGLPAPVAVAAVLALAGALSLYLGVAGACFGALSRRLLEPDGRLSAWSAAALVGAWAGLWTLAELARGQWLTGFPWVAAGYAFVDSPLAGWAPWVGVYGMGLLMAACAAAVVVAVRGRMGSRAVAVALLAATLLAPRGLPDAFTVSTGSLRVSLLQTNIAQDEKFAVQRLPESLQQLSDALHQARGDLVVAPETAVPLLPDQLEALSPGWWSSLHTHFAQERRVALVGLPLGSLGRYTNSVLSLGVDPPYRYDKHHLVPFGEFIPPGFRWFTEAMGIPLGDFARGPLEAPSLVLGPQRIGPNICYEDLFGEELAARFRSPVAAGHAAAGEQAPTVLVNVSNIGWFGDTVALPQHLNISRLRSLELQRPMLRATNTGVTALIDHRGQVLSQLPPLTAGLLEGAVEGRQGLTPYAAWVARWGLLPLWLVACGLTGLGMVAGGLRRASSR